MQKWVVAGFLALLLCSVFADVCPNGGRCEDGQTCCQHPSDGYQCCPFDQGECCGDHEHCCPAAMSCDVEKSRCVNATLSVPWAKRTSTVQPGLSKSFRMIKSNNGDDYSNVCPDQSRCPSEFSCLRALTKYGCCPLAQGTPCSDGKHCCPQGHSCSEDSRSCVQKEVTGTVLCSDGVSECPEESSCCEGADGEFGCCPMSQAVCCDDKVHCCPEGSQCDLETSKCISISSKKQLPMWAKFPARQRAEWEDQKEEHHVSSEAATGSENDKAENVESETGERAGAHVTVVTCDSYRSCPDMTTCCSNGVGGWSCCNLTNAVCCSNYRFCCPYLTTCDVVHGRCLRDDTSTPMSPQFAAVSTTVPLETAKKHATEPAQTQPTQNNVVTPNERVLYVMCNSTSACPDGTTCCTTAQREWACCGFPNAVCCRDHMHCCPHGTSCDLVQQRCVDPSGLQTTSMSPSTAAISTTAMPSTAEIMQFTENSLNEQTESEDDSDERDDYDDVDIEGRVTCKGHKNLTCPTNSTCCRLGCHKRRCCPMPNATCCRDGRHCCPKGFQCRHPHGACVKDGVVIPWYTKIPAVSSPKPRLSDNVVTPDERVLYVMCNSTSFCSDGTTCCTTAQGEWACCGFPNAVCCRDHMHCCPHGTSCDLAQQRCVDPSGLQTTSMSPSTAAISTTAMPSMTEIMQFTENSLNEQTESEDDDGHEDVDDDEDIESSVHCKEEENSSCPKNSTCCGRQKKICCALPHAICCHDGKHCCPQKYRCHPRSHTCVKDGEEIPWYSKIAALPNPPPVYAYGATLETQEIEQSQTEPPQSEQTGEEEAENIYYDSDEDDEEYGDENESVECDPKTTCPTGATCCRNGNRWGCCPLPQATCCSDGKHCCPHSYKCSVSNAACVRDDNLVIPWYSKLPAMSHPDTGSDNDVKCSDRHRCPEYQTCCKLSPEEYGCCPMENAVCCSDEKHCCPAGFSCDTSAGTCVRPVVLEVEFVPLTPATSAEGGERCGSLICPDDTKCCMNRGMPHCCKYKNGVCCDTRSCCPPGLKCGSEGGCVSDSRGFWENLVLFFQADEDDQLIL